MLGVTRALTWSSMVFTPSAPRSRVAWWTRSARPHESILKPRSSWNLAEAASASKHLKDWKQHSDLQDTDGHITTVLHHQLIRSDFMVQCSLLWSTWELQKQTFFFLMNFFVFHLFPPTEKKVFFSRRKCFFLSLSCGKSDFCSSTDTKKSYKLFFVFFFLWNRVKKF